MQVIHIFLIIQLFYYHIMKYLFLILQLINWLKPFQLQHIHRVKVNLMMKIQLHVQMYVHNLIFFLYFIHIYLLIQYLILNLCYFLKQIINHQNDALNINNHKILVFQIIFYQNMPIFLLFQQYHLKNFFYLKITKNWCKFLFYRDHL